MQESRDRNDDCWRESSVEIVMAEMYFELPAGIETSLQIHHIILSRVPEGTTEEEEIGA